MARVLLAWVGLAQAAKAGSFGAEHDKVIALATIELLKVVEH